MKIIEIIEPIVLVEFFFYQSAIRRQVLLRLPRKP
jgi:hypothetical protein